MDKSAKIRITTACVLAVAGVFSALSIISYHASDPGGGDFTSSDRVANWCGAVGAYFAGFLVENFGGPAACFAVALVAFWVYLLFSSHGKLLDAWLKIAGSVILFVSVSALTAHAGVHRYFTSVVGSFLAGRADQYFGALGAFLILFLITVLSLLLATDFMIISPLGRFFAASVAIVRSTVVRLLITTPWRRKKAKAAPIPTGRVTRPDSLLPLPKVALSSEPVETAVVKPLPILPEAELKRPIAEPAPPVKQAPPAPKQPRPAVSHEPRKGPGDYVFPSISLLDESGPDDASAEDQYIQEKAKILEDTLGEFGLAVKVIGVEPGPVITQYELELAPGIKVSRVISYSDDIAMALKAPSVRIVAPIPGRDSVGVEVPNTKKTIVRLRALLEERPPEKIGVLPVYLGRDAQGLPLAADLTEMPHLLIAGATGAGKSVCINSVILSVLLSQHPDDVKFLLVDPKMVELSAYRDIPHLISPVVTDMKKASTILEWACIQMDSRYDLLAAANVRHISRYNKLGPKGLRERLSVPPDAEIEIPDKIPYIIIIIDELADLMMQAMTAANLAGRAEVANGD